MSSNIQQFSCYFKQLPALDKHRWNGSRKAIVSSRRIKEGDDGDVYVFCLHLFRFSVQQIYTVKPVYNELGYN
jgi:hypothetical protein